MHAIRLAAISGANGVRTSMFSGAAVQAFSMAGPRPSLGQASPGSQTYAQAKAELAKFAALVDRTKKIANQTVRDQIIDQFGLADPANKDKAQYMHDAVAYNMHEVESYTPPNYLIYETPGPATNRVSDLASFNKDFDAAVTNAEVTYGILPAPVTITKIVQAPGSNVVPYLVIGAVAVAALAALGIFKSL